MTTVNSVIHGLVARKEDFDPSGNSWTYVYNKIGSMYPLRMDDITGALVVRALTSPPPAWNYLQTIQQAPSTFAAIQYTGSNYNYGSRFEANLVIANASSQHFNVTVSLVFYETISPSTITYQQFIATVPASNSFTYNWDILAPYAIPPANYAPTIRLQVVPTAGGAFPANTTVSISGRYYGIDGL